MILLMTVAHSCRLVKLMNVGASFKKSEFPSSMNTRSVRKVPMKGMMPELPACDTDSLRAVRYSEKFLAGFMSRICSCRACTLLLGTFSQVFDNLLTAM